MARFENQGNWITTLFGVSMNLTRCVNEIKTVAHDMRDVINEKGDAMSDDDAKAIRHYFGLVGGLFIAFQGLDGILTTAMAELSENLIDDVYGIHADND